MRLMIRYWSADNERQESHSKAYNLHKTLHSCEAKAKRRVGESSIDLKSLLVVESIGLSCSQLLILLVEPNLR